MLNTFYYRVHYSINENLREKQKKKATNCQTFNHDCRENNKKMQKLAWQLKFQAENREIG